MKNPLLKEIYHILLCKRYKRLTFRGGWMLTHLFYEDYKNRKGPLWKIALAHLNGWSYSDWSILGITNKNKNTYLSTKDYCLLHPLNGSYSTWIDDKLILKYILNGTALGQYMPDYYYQITENSQIYSLMDLDTVKYGSNIESIIRLLENKRLLAFKLIKSSLGVGFYKAEYVCGQGYFLNGKKYSKEELDRKIKSFRGYLVTEYLLPHPQFAKYCSNSIGCLRYTIGRKKDGDLVNISSFMRIGTTKSNFVENYAAGGVLVLLHNGYFKNGNILDSIKDKNIEITVHPDNGIKLEGYIPQWSKIVEISNCLATVMPQLSYMGIDFCITNDEQIKIIEINSLPSLDGLQFGGSIYNTSAGEFFKERLAK